jgi:hypothetical protein
MTVVAFLLGATCFGALVALLLCVAKPGTMVSCWGLRFVVPEDGEE